MTKLQCVVHGEIEASKLDYEHYTCGACFAEKYPEGSFVRRVLTFAVEDSSRRPKVGQRVNMDRKNWNADYFNQNPKDEGKVFEVLKVEDYGPPIMWSDSYTFWLRDVTTP